VFFSLVNDGGFRIEVSCSERQIDRLIELINASLIDRETDRHRILIERGERTQRIKAGKSE
jgi:hypothetical protein